LFFKRKVVMTDTEMWKEERQGKQAQHAAWNAENTSAIMASGIPHTITNRGETILIREEGRPKVDFYPSTGRWKGDGKIYSGGAQKFIFWYKRQA
jgi:hypothetical protein